MPSLPIQIKVLRRKSKQADYRIYRAGLEWDLTDAIVIEDRKDLKSESRWQDSLEPYHHQVKNLITFCRRLPVTLIADDVGLGKTISAGLIASELMSRSRLTKFLVVCPKLLGPQWSEELRTKFAIPSKVAIGRELIEADLEEDGAIITTYASARLHLDAIPQDRFQMLILDEAHKLRNLYGVDKPPQVAKCFQKALAERRFRFVLMLTATPIQNRLWDLYSLVDLLTVARGHKNPFGGEGMFARKFIADSRAQARQLKVDARDEFRSIVYGYMSRVRRGDAKLYFPERVVQMHRVDPTPEELQLIKTIARPLQDLNRLAQISILQALASSPHALMAQLNNMARNGTVSPDLAASVRAIVTTMPSSAKLHGLGALIEKLKQENPESWRLVVFTGRLETQTTIQNFLEAQDLRVGVINGASGSRNQETIADFRKSPPGYHVIVSTEAGSEGVNLQVANILVNYDLPWNPMIVEQRIGRVQRLASEHASVGIFNIMLQGTFEEYIVGRLMEKLQMASHAIGDVEALLNASGIGGEDESGSTSFDEKIRRLVVSALAGKDVEVATRQAEQSIADAKATLECEAESINSMLGGMDGAEYVGPRAPTLPEAVRSMKSREFALAALEYVGARVTQSDGVYLVQDEGRRERIHFDEGAPTGSESKLYAPGSAAFQRLVGRVIATGIFDVEDHDEDPVGVSQELARRWVIAFGGRPTTLEALRVRRYFDGTSVVRVRATVAHDAYERLVEIPCSPTEHNVETGRAGLEPLPYTLEDPRDLGIDIEALALAASLDQPISDFSRFYLERREQEMRAAGDDDRKKRRLEDEFTPRLEMWLVGIEGKVYREVELQVGYRFDADTEYESLLKVKPSVENVNYDLGMASCARSGKIVPVECLRECEVTGAMVLRHLLIQSEASSKFALPEFVVQCSLTGKRVLRDEAEVSSVSGRLVAIAFLKTSPLSGKRAEPEHFRWCELTGDAVLATELAVSEVSGKRYRVDEQVRSAVSGTAGHKSEFITCVVTGQPLTLGESEQCEVTGGRVRPGILEVCSVTGKRVLPVELSSCAATGRRALNRLLVTSSLSEAKILEEVAVRSSTGRYCAPVEAKPCLWSGRKCHPVDLRTCSLTALPIHFEFLAESPTERLQPLMDLLDGFKRTADEPQLWEVVGSKIAGVVGRGRCRVETAVLSPDRRHLAICAEVRTLLGLRVEQIGLVYAIDDQLAVGRVATGRRTSDGWSERKK